MPTEGGSLRDALAPAVERLPEMLYRGPNERKRPLTAVSSGAVQVSGYGRATLETGEVAWTRDVVHPSDRERAWNDVQRALGDDGTYDVTYRIVTADEDVRWVRDRGERLGDGTLSGYVEDVTALKEREVRLREELDETFERISDAFFALDREWRFTYVNDRAADYLDVDGEGVVGENVWEAFPAALGTDFESEYERAMETQEAVTFTEHFEPLDAHFEVNAYPSETGLSVYFRDVTERVERERRLERYEAIIETVWDGVYALDDEGRFTMVNGAYCELLGVDREELLGRRAEDVLGEGVVASAREFAEEMRRDEREAATLSFTIEADDGEKRPLEARFGPFGESGRVGVLRDVSRQRARRQQLRQQRERLSSLVALYGAANDVSNAVIEQTNRSAVEERVANRLADGPYTGAWVGRTTGTDVTRVASAGEDAPRGTELATRAVDAERVAVAESDAEGGGEAAAVPISYEGGTYGVLVVCAAHRDAFGDAERTVLGRLGTTLGHAIAALDRKAALLSEHVVQVEYRSRAVAAELGVPASGDGRFRFERTVAAGDGEYIHYVWVSGLSTEEAMAVFEDAERYRHVRLVGERDDAVLVEATTADAHVTTAIASHGGRLRSMTVRDGEVRVLAEFPQGVDLRTVTGSIREVADDVELVAQRTVARDDAEDGRVDALGDLTERQRAAFESAYYGGYFEWPRDSTAEDLAETMGVSAPTFHQHLRAAERKLLGVYVD
ncbi:PAS domain-containing protein [Halarchaeum sp. CBA1220]|uniref:bacterio-opsin activator domain-containing protein n=1 Tax=Halarchaeum sp. CBA1220 TaxID=1853682 RepID=UPI000F3A8A94|nr:bacterio-opsin activator domain-containing protein [Halarchaeum sp. CBA1220]QLC33448.1 PAS domain-containing protein [Halarchaeum sp. CBA1220]